MAAWIAWSAIAVCIVLLALVGVLLVRLLTGRGAHRRGNRPGERNFVPTTPDQTMVISRRQADEMLNK